MIARLAVFFVALFQFLELGVFYFFWPSSFSKAVGSRVLRRGRTESVWVLSALAATVALAVGPAPSDSAQTFRRERAMSARRIAGAGLARWSGRGGLSYA